VSNRLHPPPLLFLAFSGPPPDTRSSKQAFPTPSSQVPHRAANADEPQNVPSTALDSHVLALGQSFHDHDRDTDVIEDERTRSRRLDLASEATCTKRLWLCEVFT
jgi:hypothetical protein